jgi:hypothetical protein
VVDRPEPWTNIRSASTTSEPELGKIKRPRRATQKRRGVAAPHRLASVLGPRTPVTLTLTIRRGSELWLEVCTDQGRFFVSYDASAFDLVQQVIRGGHMVEELSASTALAHRRGIGHLRGAAGQLEPEDVSDPGGGTEE